MALKKKKSLGKKASTASETKPNQPKGYKKQPPVASETAVDEVVEVAKFSSAKPSDLTTENIDDEPKEAEDYLLQHHVNRVGGKRQFQHDMLARQLNCTVFSVHVGKPWGKNPLGGWPIDIVYTREFPQKNILYDNFDTSPPDHVLNYKRGLAHKHGYIYIYQAPGVVLTTDELDRQLAEEKKILKLQEDSK